MAASDTAARVVAGPAAGVVRGLWKDADGEGCGLSCDEFGVVLEAVAARLGTSDEGALRGLRLGDLALAQACALGKDVAWRRFLELYRGPVTQAAIAISGSATVGHELADSLYGDLFGLKERDGARRSPLASYMGRGSLMGWLRTTLAQRYVDRHRKTYRETPLDTLDVAAVVANEAAGDVTKVDAAVSRTLAGLPAEDRYMLAAYYLDRQTLAQIARVLRVHEATVSRRLKRLLPDVRGALLRNLEAGGMSRRAAQEALETDPRDLETNLRAALQSCQTDSFSVRGERELQAGLVE